MRLPLPLSLVLPLVLPLALALPARAGTAEVEIGGGAAFGSAVAPALSVRGGWEFFRHLTVSGRFVGLDQPPSLQYAGNGQDAEVAYQAWAVMAEANLHTAGDVQVGLAVDFGLGQAKLLYPGTTPTTGALEQGPVAPCGQVSITARLELPARLFVVLEIGAQIWSGLTLTAPVGPPASGQIDEGFLTLVNLGWKPF
ncbi:MAG: hypothetical protein ACYDCL_04965 [Myxococcales bacterium]